YRQGFAFGDRLAVEGQSPHSGADAPALAVALEPDEMIGGAVARIAGRSGRRRRAEHWNPFPDRLRRPRGERPDELAVGMAVQDRLRAVLAQDALESRRVGEAAERRGAPGERRVVDKHHAGEPTRAGLVEQYGEALELAAAELSRRHQRGGRQAGGEADDGDVAPHAEIRKCRGARVAGRPRLE